LEVKLPTIWRDEKAVSREMKKQSAGRRVRREKIRRKKMQVRETVGKSRSTVEKVGKMQVRRCGAKHIWK